MLEQGDLYALTLLLSTGFKFNCEIVPIVVDSQCSTLVGLCQTYYVFVPCGCPIPCSVKVGLPIFVQIICVRTGNSGIFWRFRYGI